MPIRPAPVGPEVSQVADATAACGITSDPSLQSNDGGGGSSLLSGENGTFRDHGGVIIAPARFDHCRSGLRATGKRRAMANKREEQLSQASVAEEEERRQAWIQHYLAEGNYAEARALGWEGTEGLPEWKQYEMQQQAAQDAAIPTMMDLKPVVPLPVAPLPFQERNRSCFPGREADRPYVDGNGVARDLVVHRHGLGELRAVSHSSRPLDKLRPFLVFARQPLVLVPTLANGGPDITLTVNPSCLLYINVYNATRRSSRRRCQKSVQCRTGVGRLRVSESNTNP